MYKVVCSPTKFCVIFSILFIRIILFLPFDVYSSINIPNEASTIKCNMKITSTCPDIKTTKWNSKNVGQEIKTWIKSVRFEGNVDKFDISSKHCKAIFVKQDSFFAKESPDMFSAETVIIGKLMPQYKDVYGKSTKFSGPVWVDMNNRKEWNIFFHKNRRQMFAELANEAVLANGLYYGELDNDQAKIEKDIIFLYPDMKTVLIGTFVDGVMIQGRASKVIAERCNDGIKEIKVDRPKFGGPNISFQRNARNRIHNPTVMDHFEKKNVYVDKTERGDVGLFARKNLLAKNVIAYYSGTIHSWKNYSEPKNITGYARYLEENYLISLSQSTYINIPKEYSDISKYRSTLGHFVNHSFRRANAYYGRAIHPRHGTVIAIITLEDIQKGNEILCSYGLEYNKWGVPNWYARAYEKEYEEPWPGDNVYEDISL